MHDFETSTSVDTQPPKSPPSSSVPPQRQSCDRCHKQKLRCTRSTNGDGGGACDRCVTKRTACVYGLSLPKGRPNLYRLMTDGTPKKSSTDSGAKSKTRDVGNNSRRASPPQSMDTYPALSSSAEDSSAPIIASAMFETPMDFSVDPFKGAWLPSVDTGWWGDFVPELGQVHNAMLSNETENIRTTFDSLDAFRLNQHPTARSSISYQNQQWPEIIPDGSIINDPTYTARGMNPDRQSTNAIVALSQLSAHLSNLRYSCYSLATSTSSQSSGSSPNSEDTMSLSLMIVETFESAAMWLANGHSGFQTSDTGSEHKNRPNTLREVLSATCRLIEIVHQQVVQSGDTVRHLILACDALVLEIFVAVLTVLEREALAKDSTDPISPVGNVRLVMIVQLCGYLLERQCQAVDRCLCFNSSQVDERKRSNGSGNVAAPQLHLGLAESKPRADLQRQALQKLECLRQILK